MSFLAIPTELLIQVLQYLDLERDINAIVLTSRRLHTVFNNYLYIHNIFHSSSRALLWAAEHGRESTLLRLLRLGADINVKTSPEYRYEFCDGTWNTALNGLYLACLYGHPNIARLLLEAGINDSEYAKGRESMPLYYALRQGHDDVALVLLRHFSDVRGAIGWMGAKSTPLHLASYLGLPELVRLLLGRGVEVGVEDADGMTALQYALFGNRDVCKECFDSPFFRMRREVRFDSKGEGWGNDVETVRLLLEAGADLNHKGPQESWWHRHSARQLAKNHPDAEMRRLCGADVRWLNRVVGWK